MTQYICYLRPLVSYQSIQNQSADRMVSSFVGSAMQHREYEAESDSKLKRFFENEVEPGWNKPCQNLQAEKSPISGVDKEMEHTCSHLPPPTPPPPPIPPPPHSSPSPIRDGGHSHFTFTFTSPTPIIHTFQLLSSAHVAKTS